MSRSKESKKRIETMRATLLPQLEAGLTQLLETTEDMTTAAGVRAIDQCVRVVEEGIRSKVSVAEIIEGLRELRSLHVGK